MLVAEGAVNARRNRQAGRWWEALNVRVSLSPFSPPYIHLVTKSRARRLPPVSVRNLSPLHWLPLTVVRSQPCSLGPLQLLTICCLPGAPQIDSAPCSQTQTEPV